MKRRRHVPVGPLVTLLAVALGVFALTASLRLAGALRGAELGGYDLIVTLTRHLAVFPDPGIVVLGVDDRAKAELGWPLPDRVVTRVVATLSRIGAAAIGLDFLRGDVPVGPQGKAADPADTDRLVALLEATPNAVVIIDTFAKELPERLTVLASPEIDRVASPTLVPDQDGVLRRGILGDVFPDPAIAPPTLGLWSFAALLVRIATRADDLQPEQPAPDNVTALGRRTLSPLAPTDGPYAGSSNVGGGYEFLARWPLTDLPILQVRDLLADRIDPAALRGKIVLIGAIARSVGDVLATPVLDHAPEAALPARSVFGVEAHAQLTAQLLMEARGQVVPLTPAPPPVWIITLSFACLAGAAAGGLIVRPTLNLPVLTIGAIAWPVLGVLAFLQGMWVAWVPPLIGWVAAAVIGFALVGWQERRQRLRLSGLFRTYLTPSVADELWANRDRLLNGDRPAPQSLVATVLFSDMRGFSTLSEPMSPPVLLTWLEAFHELMTGCVADHGGIVIDFMGDGMMAVFGAPVPRTDEAGEAADARAAVAAALAIRARLPELSEQLKRRDLPEIAVRIGIHTGPAVAGAVGGTAKLQYAVLGDTVNTASRLESWQGDDSLGDRDHCRILISEATLRHLGGIYDARTVGELTLKGKTRTVSVFRIGQPNP